MITLLISRGYVTGAQEALVFWLICAALYAAGTMAFRVNRSKSGFRPVAVAFLIAELAVDLLWCLIFYGPVGYVNLGIGSAWLMLLWPLALVVTAVWATGKNTARRKQNGR